MNVGKAASIIFILPFFIFACSSTKEIKKPPLFSHEEPVLSKGIKANYDGTKGSPENPTTRFSTDDPDVIASLKLKNLSGKHTIRWDWYDPNGNLYYSTGDSPIETSRGKYLREATAWHRLSIKGEKAAHYPGDWKVNIYLDKEFISSKSFKIKSVSPILTEVDVDIDIPKTQMKNPDAIALVIGNGKYLHKDVPEVTFAHHDAEIIKKYLIKTLGYREGNILFETDATKAVSYTHLTLPTN